MDIGILYIVGTPIGNLKDISYRAVEILKDVNFIAAEDTRVTLKLLNHYNIKNKLVSYHEHNIFEKGQQIIDKLLLGESCALVSDAGMPCVSDPGEHLVKLAIEKNVDVKVIPGASAAIAALAISGLQTSRFVFDGFLTTNKKERIEHLKNLKLYEQTLIFYEAPHKLLKTLQDLHSVFGDRKISIIKEITKIHENAIYTTISQAIIYFEHLEKVKGEFVLVVDGCKEKQIEFSVDDATSMVIELQNNGKSVSDAIKEVAEITGYKKNMLYKIVVNKNKIG